MNAASTPHSEASAAAAAVLSSGDDLSDDGRAGTAAAEAATGGDSKYDDVVTTPSPPQRRFSHSSTPRADSHAMEWAAKTPEEQSSDLARMFLRRRRANSASRAAPQRLNMPSGLRSPSDSIMSPVTRALNDVRDALCVVSCAEMPWRSMPCPCFFSHFPS